ncbi:NADP-dependent oxidoreductase domain-containing protein [Coniochaeta sp. 2T2.1]|nr:NADP-dependent oxidoreductase domain-containing protein [Coniochaeta sp. 2T2.1]
MKSTRPSLVLGARALHDAEHAASLITTAQELGITRIDTSPNHPDLPTVGQSEYLIGHSHPAASSLASSTRVESDAAGRCPLNRGQVWESVKGSLQRLNIESVDVLYIHAPDSETLLEQQAAAMDDLYRLGKFKRLGLANFSLIMLRDYLAICRSKSYILPSVYLLTYNALWRFPEAKLVPFLRQNGISIVAQSPLAGGLLTGRFTPEQRSEKERYRMYNKPCFRTAAADLVKLVSPAGMSPAEAGLRWLVWHSGLGEGDGVVLGGGRGEEVRENVRAVERGELPEEIVKGMERIWEGVREGVRR